MKFNYRLHNICGSVYSTAGGTATPTTTKHAPNLLFTADGTTLLSPVRNRITAFDLVNHTSKSYSDIQTYKDIALLSLNRSNTLLVAIDVDGRATFINCLQQVVLFEHHFKHPVQAFEFSPDGTKFAVTLKNTIELWHSPPLVKQIQPLTYIETLTGHYDSVTCLCWSDDSKYLLSGSDDNTVKIWSLSRRRQRVKQTASVGEGEQRVQVKQPKCTTLTGHRSSIKSIHIDRARHLSSADDNVLQVYSISKDGSLFVWQWLTATDDDIAAHRIKQEQQHSGAKRSHSHIKRPPKDLVNLHNNTVGHFTLAEKHYFRHGNGTTVTCAALYRVREHVKQEIVRQIKQEDSTATATANNTASSASGQASMASLLVVGFTNGTFGIYEVSSGFDHIHTLSVSTHRITTVAINATGQWLAFGSAKLGQLLVWEWQSESYILRQQGHTTEINCCTFSNDGQIIITGGEDGKVKLWNSTTGFCFITFNQHTGPVTAVEFSGTGNVVFSASVDGTVRAYDLVRYRNFRTLTAPHAAQFISMAVDTSGEVVAAGSLDPFEIYVWSLRTGKLLDILQGHEGPVCALAFSPGSDSLLASGSWDKSLRLWSIFNGDGQLESMTHGSDVLAIAYRPDGKQLCTATLDGQLSFWNTQTGELEGMIEGKRDIMPGRRSTDARSAANNTHATAYTSVTYSADGSCVLAGGNSKFICIYHIQHKLLVKKFSITNNHSLEGIDQFLNSKRITSAGFDINDVDDESSDKEKDGPDESLPGAQRGDLSSRTVKPAARTKCVRFSSTGMQWAAATTEGLVIFRLDDGLSFDPSDLSIDITPAAIVEAVESQYYSKAVVMALQLNEQQYIEYACEATPTTEIPLVARSIPTKRLQRLLQHLAAKLEQSPETHYYLRWIETLLTTHGTHIKQFATQNLPILRALLRTLNQQYTDISQLCESNQYMLDFLASDDQQQPKQQLLTAEEWKIKELEEEQAEAEAERIKAEGLKVEDGDELHAASETASMISDSESDPGDRLVDTTSASDIDVVAEEAPKPAPTKRSIKASSHNTDDDTAIADKIAEHKKVRASRSKKVKS